MDLFVPLCVFAVVCVFKALFWVGVVAVGIKVAKRLENE
jgi:hypothetical protein